MKRILIIISVIAFTAISAFAGPSITGGGGSGGSGGGGCDTFSCLSGAPTTLSGYGITDAAPAFVSGTANYFWATPNGSVGVPSLRAIVSADIPALGYQAVLTRPVTGPASPTTNNLVKFTGTGQGTDNAGVILGTMTDGKTCTYTTAGTLLSCNTTPTVYQSVLTYPVTGVASPTAGYLAKWGASGNAIVDGPQLGTLTNAKWCSFTTAGGIACTENAPGAAGSVANDAIFDAAGDLVQGTGADASAKLTKGAAGTILRAGATSNAYSTSTFADTFVIGGILHAATANTIAALAPGAVGSFLMSNGNAAALSYLAAGAANQILVGAGVTTIPVWTSSSANMISLLGSADYSTARTNLGLAISTNVQAYDADLTTYAGITPSANVQSFLGAANYAAMKTLQGYYTSGDTPTFGAITQTKTTSTAGQSVVYDDYSTELYGDGWMGSHQTGALGATRYFQFPTAANTAGQAMVFGTPAAGISIGTWATPLTSASIAATISDADTTHAPDGNSVFDALALKAPLSSPSFTTPTLGVATGTSLAVSGIIDGKVNVTVTTAATTINSTTQKQGYFINNGDSAAKGIYTLPTAALGLQYCIRNYTALTGATAVLTFQTSAAGQYIDLEGAATATGGFIHSGGAVGDAACVVGISTTQWMAYTNRGTWTKD